jgi:hypothetical protein
MPKISHSAAFPFRPVRIPDRDNINGLFHNRPPKAKATAARFSVHGGKFCRPAETAGGFIHQPIENMRTFLAYNLHGCFW